MLVGEKPIASAAARRQILAGTAPEGMKVSGHLDLSAHKEPLRLPAGLQVQSLDLSSCSNLTLLPDGLTVRHLNLDGCARLTTLPDNLRCDYLQFRDGPLRSLPARLGVLYKLDLQDCTQLVSLPERLRVQTLILRGCTGLTRLPQELEACVVDAADCTALSDWPGPVRTRIDQLDVSGCTRLGHLPDGLQVTGWLDLARSGITALPNSLRGTRLRWRGVFVDERIVFRPETLTAEEVLTEQNAERRRVMLEQMGYEQFFQQVNAEVLDTDCDAGGERRLLRVPLQWDEDLVCVSVRCPSTGRQYLLRVPPTVTSCREAVAWVAGFDDPSEYNPVLET
jgi:hypothetical protein